MIKKNYCAPTAEVVVVRYEFGFLIVSQGVNYSETPGGAGGNDGYSEDGDY